MTTATATVLDPRDPDDLRTLHRLRRSPGITVLDTLSRQRRTLAEVVPTPNAAVLDEAPRWIHYPWRHTLVHLLGPIGFRLLRLDRNRNKITTAEQDRLREVRIGVVGLSVGHAVAHTLALEAMLRKHEWDEYSCCVECMQCKRHSTDCEIAKLLEGVE